MIAVAIEVAMLEDSTTSHENALLSKVLFSVRLLTFLFPFSSFLSRIVLQEPVQVDLANYALDEGDAVIQQNQVEFQVEQLQMAPHIPSLSDFPSLRSESSVSGSVILKQRLAQLHTN